MENEIERLRKIRTADPLNIKPSPYLRQSFINESGEEKSVSIRNYQKQGIMNMLMTERMILGDDTGLGKTLSVLSTIGYVWLQEPEYVPIILTTKSALFQWKAECLRFMQDMEPIVVHGEPYERDQIYKAFFSPSSSKRLLLMTYDTMFRDADPSVIRDRSASPNAEMKRKLKAVKDAEANAKEVARSKVEILKKLTDSKKFDDEEYALGRMIGKDVSPAPGWTSHDEKILLDAIAAREILASAQADLIKVQDDIAPPIRVAGIMEHMASLNASSPNSRFMLVLDEVHKVANYRGKLHDKVKLVSMACDRVIGMTATPVKNRLMEFFGILRIIKPSLFPKVTHFQGAYCHTKMQKVSGGRQVPVVVGYKDLDKFVEKIEPYFLSRKKYDVAKELPELISVEVQCELHDLQDELYDMAEAEVDSIDMDGEESNAEALSSLTMCQQAVNAPQLIENDEGEPFEGPSSKIDALLDLLEGDANGQKVIIFSRFEKMISHVEKILNENKIRSVRITGKENNPKIRQQAKEKFQDLNSGVNVILITTAGSESLNLQAAEHFIFLDLPWSGGDYLQLIGRMIRIGSSHSTVVAHHFLALRKDGSKTIDHHVLRALREKKKLMDKVAGDALQGGLRFEQGDSMRDILTAIREAKASNETDKSKGKKPLRAKRERDPETKVSNKAAVKAVAKNLKKNVDMQDESPIEAISIDMSDI